MENIQKMIETMKTQTRAHPCVRAYVFIYDTKDVWMRMQLSECFCLKTCMTDLRHRRPRVHGLRRGQVRISYSCNIMHGL